MMFLSIVVYLIYYILIGSAIQLRLYNYDIILYKPVDFKKHKYNVNVLYVSVYR